MGRIAFKLPDIGEGIAAAEVTAWHIKLGDLVQEDSPLVDVMTDKATVEIASPVTGRVVAMHATPGETVAVGAELLVFETDASAAVDASPAAAPAPAAKALEPSPAAVRIPPKADSSAAPRQARDQPVPPGVREPQAVRARPTASPAVRRRAYEAGIGLQFVEATGPDGRITHADLDRVLAGGATRSAHALACDVPLPDDIEQVPVIGLRRKIAERMQDTKRRIPHFSYIEEVDVTALEDLRQALNGEHKQARPRLTLLPFLVRALAKALPHFPGLNACFDDDARVLLKHRALHVGIATQTPAGLVVPVLRHTEALDLWACAAGISKLAEDAREARSSREVLAGSTITITSLGALGGLATTPVINAPEVAIVGVNKIAIRPVYDGGAFVPRKIMNLSSSFDHRVVDGWVAAEFVQRLKAYLEQPATLFLE